MTSQFWVALVIGSSVTLAYVGLLALRLHIYTYQRGTGPVNTNENAQQEPSNEAGLEVVRLTNEDGKEIDAAIVDQIAFNGKTYVILLELIETSETGESKEGDTFVLRQKPSEDPEMFELEELDNEGELEALIAHLDQQEQEELAKQNEGVAAPEAQA